MTEDDELGREPALWRRWTGWSLRASLVVAVVLPLALAAVGGTVLVMRVVEEAAVDRMQDEVELVARAIRGPLSRSLELGRETAVVTTLESAFQIGRVYGASLYDEEGELVVSVGAGTREEPDRVEELAEGADRLGEYAEAGGREVYSYFVPLSGAAGRSLGVLELTRQRSDIDAHVAELRTGALGLLGGVLLLITGLVLVGHHRAVGRPLSRLLGSMGRVEAGVRGHRARREGPREIARLATGLNAMLDSIDAAEAEVQERRNAQTRLETELREAEKLAAVGRLSAGVAHELGSPLSVVDGKAQRLLRADHLSPPHREELEGLRREVRRMESIVRQLLQFGKEGGGTPRLVEAGTLARSAAAAAREELRRHDVELELEGPAPGPELEVDPARVEGALSNLLRNAAHAAPGGWIRLRWGPAGEEEGGWAEFTVEDDGPGLSPEVQSRVFEPFFTTKATGEGTGLGLAVVHGVAEEHGGQVTAENRSEGGALFRLVLPIRSGADGERSAPSSFTSSSSAAVTT